MQAVGTRRVRSGKEYDYLFPFPTGNDGVIKKSADVNDTVKFIQEQVPKTTWQTEKFARFIKGKSLNDTCSRIWHFLYDHIPYKKDEDGIEQIRSPRRSWYDRNKPNEFGEVGIDCDCFSVIISSTLLSLKIPHKYRITKYPKEPPEVPRWQHIYIVVPKDGKLDYDLDDPKDYIVMDCVKNRYDDEEPFLEFKDYKANMRLDYLDGLDGQEYEIPDSVDVQDIASMYDEEELGKIGQWLKKAVKNVGKAAGKVIRTINKVANPATIVLRNGFLLAMKTNVVNVAKRLRYAYLSDAQAQKMGMNLSALGRLRKIMEKAETIYWQAGGKKENLKLAILKGKGNRDNKVPLSGLFGNTDDILYMDMDEYNIINGFYGFGNLGAAPVAMAPAMAAVTAIAVALKEVKDLFKPGTKESQDMASETDAEAPAQIPAEIVSPDYSEEAIMNTSYAPAPMQVAPRMMKEQASPDQTNTSVTTTTNQAPATTTDASETPPGEDPKEGFFQKAGKWVKENPGTAALIGAGVGVGAYLLLRNKNSGGGLAGTPAKKKRKTAKKKTVKKTPRRKRTTKRVRAIKI